MKKTLSIAIVFIAFACLATVGSAESIYKKNKAAVSSAAKKVTAPATAKKTTQDVKAAVSKVQKSEKMEKAVGQMEKKAGEMEKKADQKAGEMEKKAGQKADETQKKMEQMEKKW